MIVIEARSAREGGAKNFVIELIPRLEAVLAERGKEVEVISGPPASSSERFRRRRTYLRARTIFHTGNRVTFAPRAYKVVIMRDRGLLPVPVRPPARPLRQRVRAALILPALAAADALVVPTHSMVGPIEELRRRYHLRRSPIHVVPYGRPNWSPPEPRAFRDPVALLLVGIPAWHKNVPFMADVLRASRGSEHRVQLTITAGGDEVVQGKPLRSWFHDVASDVTFVGGVSRAGLPALFSDHDILVFPSHYESFGQPLVEAMTMSMPVVSVDSDWARELCDDTAVYAPLGDAEAWARAIQQVAAAGRRENPAGLARSKLFDWDRTALMYADLLTDHPTR